MISRSWKPTNPSSTWPRGPRAVLPRSTPGRNLLSLAPGSWGSASAAEHCPPKLRPPGSSPQLREVGCKGLALSPSQGTPPEPPESRGSLGGLQSRSAFPLPIPASCPSLPWCWLQRKVMCTHKHLQACCQKTPPCVKRNSVRGKAKSDKLNERIL